MVRKMGMMAREELGLGYWFPPLRPYLLKDEVGLGVACTAFSISLSKGMYSDRLQWDSMRKDPTAWANLYGSGVLGMGDTIYARDRKFFTEIACPTKEIWFGKFMRGSKLRMGLIEKQDFGYQ